jgi:hypothetical protein
VNKDSVKGSVPSERDRVGVEGVPVGAVIGLA